MKNVLNYKNNNDEDYLERTQRNHFLIGGVEVQYKIRALKIGVAGLGGMGSNIAEYLARMGVGELRLADNDTIDMSNINRQVIANYDSVGKKKSQASCDELRRIAPDCNISIFDKGINADCVEEFVKGCDFIVDEIDVFPIEAHYILHKACRKHKIPVYSSYVVGLGIHFYKFQGEKYKFEDFISYSDDMNSDDLFNEISKKFAHEKPKYLNEEKMVGLKDMAMSKGLPIFGPSCLVGHSIVVTRILCDFLDSKILGTEVEKTPIMPDYIKVDLSTFEIKKLRMPTV